MARLTTLFANWAALNGADPEAPASTTDLDTNATVTPRATDDAFIEGIPPVPPPAISAGVTSPGAASPAGGAFFATDPSQIPAPPLTPAASGTAYSEALLRACASLSDEVLRALPATPEDAAAELAESPFA